MRELLKFPRAFPTGSSFEDFVASTGMSVDTIKARLIIDSKVGKLLEKVTSAVEKPSQGTIKKYYDEHLDEFQQPASVNASHILVSTRGITDEAELKKKDELLAEIQKQLADKEGKSFEELASAHSDCPSKAQGGDLGNFGKGQMVPEFEAAAFSQEIGIVGEPVKTQFGYHLIKVTDKKEGKLLSFEEVEERVTQQLYDEGKNETIKDFITGLRDKAKIEMPGQPQKTEE